MEKIVQKFTAFLDFRDLNRVDDIRNEILYKSMTPYEFPYGKQIINLVPQIVLAHDALDNFGNPMSLEEFGFAPDLVMKSVTKEDFLRFIIYTLEYRVLVLEQLSDLKEKAYLAQFPENMPPVESPPYGVILQCCTIRDFGKFGLENVSADGRQILSWILGVAMDNYPELLFRSHFVRVPWVFNTLWTFVKGLIDPNTLKKVTMNGADYIDKLLEDLPLSSIPKRLGGSYEGYNTAFEFNVSETGPFHFAGRPVFSASETALMTGDLMAQARAYIDKHGKLEKLPGAPGASGGGYRLASVGGVTVTGAGILKRGRATVGPSTAPTNSVCGSSGSGSGSSISSNSSSSSSSSNSSSSSGKAGINGDDSFGGRGIEGNVGALRTDGEVPINTGMAGTYSRTMTGSPDAAEEAKIHFGEKTCGLQHLCGIWP